MTIDTSTHRNLLLRILKKIYTDTTLGPILGFKGGTAVYLFYDLPRFSVDLDFDLLDKEKENFVYERIEAIIKKFGTIKTQYKKRNTGSVVKMGAKFSISDRNQSNHLHQN